MTTSTKNPRRQTSSASRRRRVPAEGWSLRWEASWTWWGYYFLGAIIQLPFGLLVIGGVVVGGSSLATKLRDLPASELATTLLLVLASLLVGGLLGFVLLRSGGAMALDLLGARTTLEGPVEKSGSFRSSHWVEVRGVHIRVPESALRHLTKGRHVRVSFGRFERELTTVWVRSPTDPRSLEPDEEAVLPPSRTSDG